MRFEHLLRIVETEPWLIRPGAHATIRRVLAAHIDGSAHQAGGISALFEKRDEPKLEKKDGVAVVPIYGIIGQRVSALEKSSGVADVYDISRMITEAEADPEVTSILLDIDSPGGTLGGVPELAERIANAKKYTMAYTGGQMDSAAYWIGSAAKAVYASRSAAVGSIGVYMAILDESRAYAMAGYDMEVIKSGVYKAAGLPGTALTKEQREQFQAQVDYIAAQFKSHVRSHRKTVQEGAMAGQEFYAEQAQSAGLVDSIADFYKAVDDTRVMGQRNA